MNCMKCGQEIPNDQVFCEECLLDMEKHPVKPDTPVLLPPRALDPNTKRPPVHHHHRRLRKPEDTISRLRSWVILLGVLTVALALAFAMAVTLVLRLMDQPPPPNESAGQNYSTNPIAASSTRK